MNIHASQSVDIHNYHYNITYLYTYQDIIAPARFHVLESHVSLPGPVSLDHMYTYHRGASASASARNYI